MVNFQRKIFVNYWIAVKDCYFLFNNQVFRQIDGVAMGSPLGPTLANAFLTLYEDKWLNECPVEFKPSFYKRYVDDTFMLFSNQNQADQFLKYLNSKHNCIKFTCELEKDGSLPFLDVLVQRTGSLFTTSIYRKPTFTGLGMKFNSFLPINYKRNIIGTLVYRAYKISSNFIKLHQDISFLRNFFINNGFPLNFIDTYIGKTLSKFFITTAPPLTCPKRIVYFALPFLGNTSFSFRNRINKLFSTFYPNCQLRFAFTSHNTIGRGFVFKDRIPTALQSSIIYKYNCGACNASYVGKTTRHFFMRIAEHKGVSFRTDKPLSKPSFSAIRQHSIANNHPILDNNFEVLHSVNPPDLLMLETLYLNKLKPSLCNSESSIQLICF